MGDAAARSSVLEKIRVDPYKGVEAVGTVL
jgi:hypothetical protein